MIPNQVLVKSEEAEKTENPMQILEDKHTGEAKYHGHRDTDELPECHDDIEVEEIVRLTDQV